MNNQLYIKNVATLSLDPSKCNGCGMCVIVCPHRIFQLANQKVYITNRDKCMECGACAKNCANQAINVKSGVGCATAILNGMLNKTEPTCGCSDSGCC